jgi:hypothetical protein
MDGTPCLRKMNNRLAYFINTRLQPGVESSAKGEPFQRLICGGKPLKRFLSFPVITPD